MNELYTWFSHQHHGLRTFRTFQQKLENLSTDEPGHRGLYRLLSNLVGRYVEAFDEEPLPISVADRAYDRLLELLGSLDLRATADRRLADIDRVAASDPVALQQVSIIGRGSKAVPTSKHAAKKTR